MGGTCCRLFQPCCCKRGEGGCARVSCCYCFTNYLCKCGCRRGKFCTDCCLPTAGRATASAYGYNKAYDGYESTLECSLSDARNAHARALIGTLQTGDVVLCCGNHPFGEFARLLSNCEFDHVALVVRGACRSLESVESAAGKVEVGEEIGSGGSKTNTDTSSNTDNKHHDARRGSTLNKTNILSHKKLASYHIPCEDDFCRCYMDTSPDKIQLLESTGDGVHLFDAYERLLTPVNESKPKFAANDPLKKKKIGVITMSGRYEFIAVRRLRDFSPDGKNIADLESFLKQVRGQPYEQNREELKDAIMRIRTEEEDWSGFSCGELTAEALQQYGVLNEDIHSNNYLPADFVPGTLHEAKLQHGARLDGIEVLKAPFHFHR